MTSCPIDGSVRKVIARDRYSVQYQCPTCGTFSEERFKPTNLLPKGTR